MAVSWYEAWGPAVAPLWTQRGVPSDDFVGVVVQVTWDDTRGTYFVSSFVTDLCTASFLLLALSLNSCFAFGFCFVAFLKIILRSEPPIRIVRYHDFLLLGFVCQFLSCILYLLFSFWFIFWGRGAYRTLRPGGCAVPHSSVLLITLRI